MSYTEFANQTASQKVVLAIVNAKKRLVGWEVHSGSVYKLENQDYAAIESIEDSGTSYAEVADVSSITASKYYYDRDNNTLYLQATDSSNPNSRFLVVTIKNYFANSPQKLAHDLSTGYDVYWHPFIDNLSKYGVELDNSDQVGVALEGTGKLSMINDRDFWDNRYDRLTWENQECKVYSWSPTLDPSDAKLIFQGVVNTKSYNDKKIVLTLKDRLINLRQDFVLENMEDVAGVKIPSDLNEAKQRRIYGKVLGLIPTNIDQAVPDVGYPLTGTASFTAGSATVTGSGTAFYAEVSPDDVILSQGERYTVEAIVSDTELTLSDNYAANTASGQTIYLEPALSKTYINREWLVAGHALNQPSTTVVKGISQNTFTVADDTDFFVGDDIYIGTEPTGEFHTIDRVSSNLIKITQNLATVPTAGVTVKRLAVQDVRINQYKLRYVRDYTFDATNAKITLNTNAEFNVSPIGTINGTLTFNGTRTVTGSGTAFEKAVEPGQFIRLKTEANWYQVSSVESDTSLTLQTAAGYSGSGTGQLKQLRAISLDEDVLSCDVYGTTDDDTSSGVLLRTGAEIIKDILELHGMSSFLNAASFARATDEAPQLLGFAIPDTYSDTTTLKLREYIQRINQSILSSVVQNEDFEIECNILRPSRPTTLSQFREYDIISFNIDTFVDKIVKETVIRYGRKEYGFEGKANDVWSFTSKLSDSGQYLTQSQSTNTIDTLLVNEADAQIFANRWTFLQEIGTGIVKLTTKLQGAQLQVSDKIEIFHQKFYERLGGGKQKVAAISSLTQSGAEVDMELEDLGNAYTRVCLIAPTGHPDYNDATQEEKWQAGFITDNYGMINNDENTFNQNLIW
jgi:hypothetical protein